MKIILATLMSAMAATMLAACALLQPLRLDDDARLAARVTLETYEALQKAVLIYARLPRCSDPPTLIICRNEDHWRRLKEAERTATGAITALTPALNAGTGAHEQWQEALTAIAAVAAAITRAHSAWDAAP